MTVPGRCAMPPNVLWICADDYTPEACGAYGNPLARTVLFGLNLSF